MTTPKLTPAQERLLAEVRSAGRKHYNGAAWRPIEALEAAGLVHVEWDVKAAARGNEVVTVTAFPTSVTGTVNVSGIDWTGPAAEVHDKVLARIQAAYPSADLDAQVERADRIVARRLS